VLLEGGVEFGESDMMAKIKFQALTVWKCVRLDEVREMQTPFFPRLSLRHERLGGTDEEKMIWCSLFESEFEPKANTAFETQFFAVRNEVPTHKIQQKPIQ
jgi:hypothetical protein